jgi:hypothetical protein
MSEVDEFKGVRNVGAMKKKAKSKAAKKGTKKKTTQKKQADAAQVHEDIAGMVRAEAREITDAVIAQAMNGELAPAKYLFEMAGVYPPATDGTQSTTEEDCLARTLMDRLRPPQKPAAMEAESVDATAGDEDKASGESSADPDVVDVLPSTSGG